MDRQIQFRIVAILGCVVSSVAYAGGITIDGQTPTVITSASGGGVQIKVAPADSAGTSLNTYRDFNVSKNGVTLNNKKASARTIVNEVTSTNRSQILGKVAVDGPKADVIIANPNGIFINGASFQNTGNALFVTGRSVPGDPTRFSVSGGDLTVGSEGFSAGGADTYFHAANISVDGAINAAGAAVSFSAGTGTLATASSGPLGWAVFTPDATGSGKITVSNSSIISGGSITMTAPKAASSINLGGSVLASVGGFNLATDGVLTIANDIVAHDTARLTAARGISIEGSQGDKVKIKSETEAVIFRSEGDIQGSHFDISGADINPLSFETNASISISSGRDLSLSDGEIAASGSGLEVLAENRMSLASVTTSSSKTSALTAGSGIVIDNSAVNSAGVLFVDSEDDLTVSKSGLLSESGVNLSAAGSIAVGEEAGTRSQIKSSAGGVVLTAGGNLEIKGAAIDGASQTDGDDASQAAVTIKTDGDFILETTATNRVGSVFASGADQDLQVTVGGSLRNRSGRLLAESDIRIVTKGAFESSVVQQGEENPGLGVIPHARAHYGTNKFGNEIPQLVAGGRLDINAKSFTAAGVNMSGTDVSVSADAISINPERFGTYDYKRTCFLVFCKVRGKASITHDGGAVTATGTLTLKSAEAISLVGAQLSGEEGIVLSAPNFDVRGNAYMGAGFYRRAGISSIFSGRTYRPMATFDTAILVSENGAIRFVSDDAVTLGGVTMFSKDGILASNGYDLVDTPPRLAELNELSIGRFASIMK